MPRPSSRRFVSAALASAALLTLPAAPAAAATDAAAGSAALREQALGSDLAWELVASLTTEVGPRLAGSEGDRRAVAWGLAAMQRLGFTAVRAEPVTVPRWERGEAEAEILEPFPQPLQLTAIGGSVGTPEAGIVAEVVRFSSVEELAQAPEEQVRGRIVFLDRQQERRRDGSSYVQVVANRSAGPSAAARKGALALVIRSAGTGPHRFPHTGAARWAEGVPRLPAAALAVPDADLLARQLASGRPVRLRLRLTARDLGNAQSANVIGEVRGATRPEEIVLLGCHLDSWDLGTGAIDDGAGCAIVMAAAALIAQAPQRPARTLRVVLFANEEFGLSGSDAYAEQHAEELPRHVLAVEADLGAGRIWGFAGRTTPEGEAVLREIHPDLAPLGIEWLSEPAFGGADLLALIAKGVPVADLRHDATLYFDYHHTADDTLDKIDPQALQQCVAAHAVLAWRVASDHRPLGPAPPRQAAH